MSTQNKAEDVLEFLRRVRELCERFDVTLVGNKGGVFHVGVMMQHMGTMQQPQEALAKKVGSLRHISPHGAEFDTGNGIFQVIK